MLPLYGYRFGEASFLYPFRYRCERTGKWIRARYVASRADIAARYTEWQIVGEPEVRRPIGGSFNPWRAPT